MSMLPKIPEPSGQAEGALCRLGGWSTRAGSGEDGEQGIAQCILQNNVRTKVYL